jgi:hypothetical protein
MDGEDDFTHHSARYHNEGPPEPRLTPHQSEGLSELAKIFRVDSQMDYFLNRNTSVQPSLARNDSIQSNCGRQELKPLEDLHHSTSFKVVDPSPKNNKLNTGFSPFDENTHAAAELQREPSLSNHGSRRVFSYDSGAAKEDLSLVKRMPIQKIKQEQIKAEEQDESEDEGEGLSLNDLPPNQRALVCIIGKMLDETPIVSTDFAELKKIDLEVLRSIVKRKFQTDLEPLVLESRDRLAPKLNEICRKQETSKRSEENNKLVFKRAMKTLLTQYKEGLKPESKKNKHKRDFEIGFCKKYFSGIQLPKPKQKPDSKAKKDPRKQEKKSKKPQAALAGATEDPSSSPGKGR